MKHNNMYLRIQSKAVYNGRSLGFFLPHNSQSITSHVLTVIIYYNID